MSGFVFSLFLIAAGAYTAYRLRFFCFLHPISVLKTLTVREPEQAASGYSPSRALAVALAGTLGVGNITGVAAAILLGGPGALFWMWVSALCTMLIKYAEVYLAVITRRTIQDGRTVRCAGGPMRYLRLLPGGAVWSVLFCLLCIGASFLQGNLLQSTAALSCVTNTFAVPPVPTAVVFSLAAALLVFGGRGRIAAFCSAMIPLLSVLYAVMGLTVILCNAASVPAVLSLVFRDAFSMRALGIGGSASMLLAMRHGCAKGVFTHEAGCGTAPISHAGAETACPEKQATLGIAEVFVDTMVLCTITGLVLLLSGVGSMQIGAAYDYQAVVLGAFRMWFGDAAAVFITVSIVFYAFAALVCWSFYGTECLRYLLSDCGELVTARGVTVYLSFYVLCTFLGVWTEAAGLWQISDVLTMAMTALNTCGVMVLLGRVKVPVRETKYQKTIDSTRQL